MRQSFDRLAETYGHTHDAIGAKMKVQIRDDVRGITPVIDHEDVFGDLGDGAHGHDQLRHVAGVELHGGDQRVEQVVTGQQACGGDTVVLVAVPAELLAEPFLVGQAETGAVGRPKAHAFPALDLDGGVKKADAKQEHVLEKPGQDLLPGLYQRAFRRRAIART